MKEKKLSRFKTIQGPLNKVIRLCMVLSLFIFANCKNNQDKILGGTWSIKEIRVNQKNFLPFLYVNTFGFHCEDKSAWFHASYFFESDKLANWEVVENNGIFDSIKIKSKIKIYNDSFKIKITKSTESEQLHLIMESKNVYISAYKIVDDY